MYTKLGKTRWIIASLGALVLGVFFLVHGLSVVSGLKNAAKLESTAVSSFEDGMWVKGKTEIVWDYYCSESETKNGIESETYRWYLVIVETPDNEDCFLGVKVPSTEYSNYEKLKGEDPEYELTFQGKLVTCSGDILKYKKQFMDEIDEETMTEQGIKFSQVVLYPDYYVELTTTKSGNTFITVGAFCIAIGLLLGLYIIYSIRKDSKQTFTTLGSTNAVSGSTVYGGTAGMGGAANPVQGGAESGYNSGDPLQQASVGASTGFYRQDDQDELSRLLAEEDQKVANYNFMTGLTGSDRVEEDK